MSGDAPAQYEFPNGHHLVRCYPVEGEPFVECWYGKEVWGQVQIAGVDDQATGEARLANCHFVVCLYPRDSTESPWWEFALTDVQAQLEKAEDLLRENERGRQPLANDEDLTAAGMALTKMGDPEAFSGER